VHCSDHSIHVGCVVIRPDGSRKLAHVEPGPLAQQKLD
jgi:hypothetical protein